MEAMEVIFVVLVGLALGSFANAVVWRLHQQASLKSKSKHRPGLSETQLSITRGRSICPHCHHQLAWYDLLPVVSWLALRGHCRYCKKAISWQYPLVELVVALAAGLSYYFWPYSGSQADILLGIWLPILAGLAALALYDIRWMRLPNQLIYALLAMVAIFKVVEISSGDVGSQLISAVAGALLLGGFFWLLYQVSKGKWIGGGDVRYGVVMGLLLGWQKALLGLALSSYLGVIVIIVLLVMGKYKKNLKLPFGPLLIGATFICVLWGTAIVDTYKRFSGF